MSNDDRTVVDGYLVEPLAASEAKVGWRLLLRDRGVYEVRDLVRRPARREGENPQVKILVDRPPFSFTGEQTLTIYRVIAQVPPRIAKFLERRRLGSLVRPDDASASVWDEMLRGGWLEQVPDDGYGYPLPTYRVIAPPTDSTM